MLIPIIPHNLQPVFQIGPAIFDTDSAKNPSDDLWAISTRCRPDKDVFAVPGVPSFARDPFQRHWGRMGIDATVPFELAKEFERKKIPSSVGVK